MTTAPVSGCAHSLVAENQHLGSEDLRKTYTTIISIALGVLIGSAAYTTATAGVHRVVTTLPPPLTPWRNR